MRMQEVQDTTASLAAEALEAVRAPIHLPGWLSDITLGNPDRSVMLDMSAGQNERTADGPVGLQLNDGFGFDHDVLAHRQDNLSQSRLVQYIIGKDGRTV